MKRQIGLGVLTGLVGGLLCWSGNQSEHVVSTFPDALTAVVFAGLLAVAIRFGVKTCEPTERRPYLRAGLTVATTAGVVFGAAVVGVGLDRFTHPSPVLLAFGFFTALGFAIASGAIAVIYTARPRWFWRRVAGRTVFQQRS